MKKVILLAGYPATGKTYMSNIIKEKYSRAIYIAQDEIKELLYDKVGFDNLKQKEELVDYGREIFYQVVKQSLAINDIVLLDYPFSYKQLDFLQELEKMYDCEMFTICLTGNLDILYDRRVERDLVASRNKAHILNSYHGYETYDRSTYPLSREEYIKNCENGQYDKFEYGKTIKVDVSDYSLIDYPSILLELNDFIGE